MKAHAFALLLLIGALLPSAGIAERSTNQGTIANLNAAIQAEANAAHRYLLFARKADEEGHRQVAKLFRAAALSEATHKRNHERVLRELGLEPKAPEIEAVKVGTTRENLDVPIKGEADEAEATYPAFVKEARRASMPSAARSFQYALDTEAQHEKLFKDALANLGHNPPTDYYVGQVSGQTLTSPSTRERTTKVE